MEQERDQGTISYLASCRCGIASAVVAWKTVQKLAGGVSILVCTDFLKLLIITAGGWHLSLSLLIQGYHTIHASNGPGADSGGWIGWLATHLDNANNIQITKYYTHNHDFSVELVCNYKNSRICVPVCVCK